MGYTQAIITITGKYNNGYRTVDVYGDTTRLYSGAPSSTTFQLDVSAFSTLKITDPYQGPYWAGATVTTILRV